MSCVLKEKLVILDKMDIMLKVINLKVKVEGQEYI